LLAEWKFGRADGGIDILPDFAKSKRDVYHAVLRRGALFLCLRGLSGTKN
jgi:hypothetical protein